MEPTVALNGVWHSYGDASDGWTLKGVPCPAFFDVDSALVDSIESIVTAALP